MMMMINFLDLIGSLKIYANACICIYFNEAFHRKAMKIFSIKSRKLIPIRDAALLKYMQMHAFAYILMSSMRNNEKITDLEKIHAISK